MEETGQRAAAQHLQSEAQSPSRVPLLLALSALALGFLAGVRWPGLFAMTQLLFDYSSGVIRRGLVGEVLSYFVGQRVSYLPLALFSFAALIAWLAMLFALVARAARVDSRIWLFVAVFFVSPGFVVLVHNVGFLDHIGLVVTLGCFLLPATRSGLVGRMLLCAFMVMVHEGFALMFFPVVAVEYWLRASAAERNRAGLATLALIGVTAAATLVAVNALLPREQMDAYSEYLQGRSASFKVRADAVAVVFGGAYERIATMRALWQDAGRRAHAFMACMVMLPLPAASSWLSVALWKRSVPRGGKPQRLLHAAVVVGTFTPLLVNFIAWDLWRFFATTQVCGFLVLLAICRQAPGALFPASWARTQYYAIAIFAVLGATTAPPLYDGHEVVRPPFQAHFKYLYSAVCGDTPWLRVPSDPPPRPRSSARPSSAGGGRR